MNKDQFKKINENEIVIYIQPNNLQVLNKTIKDLVNFKNCIETKKYE